MAEQNAEQGVLGLGDEPGTFAARVIDRDGDVWATAGGCVGPRWGCLTTASAPQTWSDLWHVCGPLRLSTPPEKAGQSPHWEDLPCCCDEPVTSPESRTPDVTP